MGGIAIGILMGLGFIGLGAFALLDRETIWNWTAFGNKVEGVASQRSDEWEMGRVASGIILIVIGLAFTAWMISASNHIEDGSIAATNIVGMMNTRDANALVQDLNKNVLPHIESWKAVSDRQVHYLPAESIGYSADYKGMIYYGRCNTSDFYLFISFSGGGSTNYYAYSPKGDPAQCTPTEQSSVLSSEPRGGDWYHVSLYGEWLNPDNSF